MRGPPIGSGRGANMRDCPPDQMWVTAHSSLSVEDASSASAACLPRQACGPRRYPGGRGQDGLAHPGKKSGGRGGGRTLAMLARSFH